MAATKTKKWMSMSAAARELGIDHKTLARAGRENYLYAPAMRRIAGCRLIGRDLCLYHAEQVRLMLAVNVSRTMELKEAELRWEIFRRRIADKRRGAK